MKTTMNTQNVLTQLLARSLQEAPFALSLTQARKLRTEFNDSFSATAMTTQGCAEGYYPSEPRRPSTVLDDLRKIAGEGYSGTAEARRDARKLHEAMSGLGTDEEAIFKVLEGKTPAQIAAIRAEYRAQFGESLDAELESELSGPELHRAQAAMDGDRAAGAAVRIHEAMSGAGTDEKAVYKELEGKSPSERAEIQRAYANMYGDGDINALRNDIRSDFSGAELDLAEGLLDGNVPRAEAARIHLAIEERVRSGETGPSPEIEAMFRKLDPATRRAVEAQYDSQYGDLRGDLADALGPYGARRATVVLDAPSYARPHRFCGNTMGTPIPGPANGRFPMVDKRTMDMVKAAIDGIGAPNVPTTGQGNSPAASMFAFVFGQILQALLGGAEFGFGAMNGAGMGSMNPLAAPGRINNNDVGSEVQHQSQVAGILNDPSLTVEDKVMLMLMLIMQKMDKDIEKQNQYLNQIQQQQGNREGNGGGLLSNIPVVGGALESFFGGGGGEAAPSIDLESQKLQRMVTKRQQMFDTLKGIMDKYAETAKGVIQSIGR